MNKSVLTESIRTLKSGGVIHIAEPDYLSATFFSENIDFEKKLINIIVKERIPNSYKVRTLPRVLKQIGFNKNYHLIGLTTKVSQKSITALMDGCVDHSIAIDHKRIVKQYYGMA